MLTVEQFGEYLRVTGYADAATDGSRCQTRITISAGAVSQGQSMSGTAAGTDSCTSFEEKCGVLIVRHSEQPVVVRSWAWKIQVTDNSATAAARAPSVPRTC
jgi:hypothetical protein